jgi:orotate phosphoribosyltransferase
MSLMSQSTAMSWANVAEDTMPTKTERLLQAIVETSFHFSTEPVYPLASGALSKYYIDCKKALSYPDVRELIGDLIVDQVLFDDVDAVGGLALGAYPVAVAVSDAVYRKLGKTIRAFVVRKEPKAHGLKKHIEGDVGPGDKVLIVDDVITSGNSTVDAIVKSRDEGLNVVRAVVLIDRQELRGAQTIKESGTPFTTLFTLTDLIRMEASLSRK